MKRRMLLLLGLLLVVASIVIPVLTAMNINIIGGADWPTFAFHFGKTSWMTVVGIGLVIASAVFLRRKE